MSARRLEVLQSHLKPVVEVPENFVDALQTSGNYPGGLLKNQVAIITGSGITFIFNNWYDLFTTLILKMDFFFFFKFPKHIFTFLWQRIQWFGWWYSIFYYFKFFHLFFFSKQFFFIIFIISFFVTHSFVGQGIGEQAAYMFAKEGAKVVVTDIDVEKSQRVAATIKQAGGEAIAIPGKTEI